jgi:hypothetical protein
MLSVQPPRKRKSNNMISLYRGNNSRNRPNRANATNVVFLRRPIAADPARAFQALTAQMVLQQHRDGTLNPAVVEALLAGVGLKP